MNETRYYSYNDDYWFRYRQISYDHVDVMAEYYKLYNDFPPSKHQEPEK